MGQPIESDDVRGLLTAACPRLAEPFAEEDADSSERLNYLEITAAVRWLAARVRGGDESCLPAVFEVAERVPIDGTKSARDLVIVGLFEDLQNHNVTGGVEWSVWERYLGPLSRDARQAVIDFWGGEGPSPRGGSNLDTGVSGNGSPASGEHSPPGCRVTCAHIPQGVAG